MQGVADGNRDFDAVNVRQFANSIAALAASSSIPAPEAGKRASLGMGVGSFMDRSALAIGLNVRMWDRGAVKATVASGRGGGQEPVVGVGAGWSW